MRERPEVEIVEAVDGGGSKRVVLGELEAANDIRSSQEDD
jgi:hypothetical protein